jgi:hypothetical protein
VIVEDRTIAWYSLEKAEAETCLRMNQGAGIIAHRIHSALARGRIESENVQDHLVVAWDVTIRQSFIGPLEIVKARHETTQHFFAGDPPDRQRHHQLLFVRHSETVLRGR